MVTNDDARGWRGRSLGWPGRLHAAVCAWLPRDDGLGLVRPFSPRACGIALGVIFAVDAVFARTSPSLPIAAVLDESAHLATAVLLLAALRVPLPKAFVVGVLIGAVAIDVDHVPRVLGWHFLTRGTSRPYTHSWLSPALAAIASRWRSGSGRVLLAGLAAGFLAHFVRDAATGDGLALLWPMTTASVRVPYWTYAAFLIVMAALGMARPRRQSLTLP